MHKTRRQLRATLASLVLPKLPECIHNFTDICTLTRYRHSSKHERILLVLHNIKDQPKEAFFQSVTCGVQQGSLLGSRLFTYYINDLSNSINERNLELYADETTLHFIGINVDVVVDGLNRALLKFSLCSVLPKFQLKENS